MVNNALVMLLSTVLSGVLGGFGSTLPSRRDVSGASTSFASDGGNVSIRDGWVQEPPPSKDITAAYMIIENRSAADIYLLSAITDAASAVELHKVEMDGGMMKMRRVPRIAVPAGGSTELKPGGYHLMVIGLKKALKDGDKVRVQQS